LKPVYWKYFLTHSSSFSCGRGSRAACMVGRTPPGRGEALVRRAVDARGTYDVCKRGIRPLRRALGPAARLRPVHVAARSRACVRSSGPRARQRSPRRAHNPPRGRR
jgi:hypothetical protein